MPKAPSNPGLSLLPSTLQKRSSSLVQIKKSRRARKKLSLQSCLSFSMIRKLSITYLTVILLRAATFKSDSSVYVLRMILQQMTKNSDKPAIQHILAAFRKAINGKLFVLCMLLALLKMQMLSNSQYNKQKLLDIIFVTFRKVSVLLLWMIQMRLNSNSDLKMRKS